MKENGIHIHRSAYHVTRLVHSVPLDENIIYRSPLLCDFDWDNALSTSIFITFWINFISWLNFNISSYIKIIAINLICFSSSFSLCSNVLLNFQISTLHNKKSIKRKNVWLKLNSKYDTEILIVSCTVHVKISKIRDI